MLNYAFESGFLFGQLITFLEVANKKKINKIKNLENSSLFFSSFDFYVYEQLKKLTL